MIASELGAQVEVGRLAIEWAVAYRALPGESRSGDAHLVAPFPGGVLLAAVDGLGHGAAAQLAVSALGERPGESVIALVQRCHALLRDTRGAVMSLASLRADDSTLTWIGVGNVEATIFRGGSHPVTMTGVITQREDILLRPGLVGYQLSTLRALMIPVAAGDTLVFATDGIQSSFKEDAAPNLGPRACADRILATFVKPNDDALVLVARVLSTADDDRLG